MASFLLDRRDDLVGGPAGESDVARIVTEAWAGHTTGYLARLEPVEPSPLYDVRREFLQPDEDQVNRFGNGRRVYRVADAGVYEAESRYHQSRVRRHWLEIDDSGAIVPLATLDDAIAACWHVTPEDLHRRRLADWTQRPSDRGWRRLVARAARENAVAGLVALEGTSKQVAYAEVCRWRRLTALRGKLERDAATDTEGRGHAPREGLARRVARIAAVSDARWWIDHRRRPLRALVRAAAEWHAVQAAIAQAAKRVR